MIASWWCDVNHDHHVVYLRLSDHKLGLLSAKNLGIHTHTLLRPLSSMNSLILSLWCQVASEAIVWHGSLASLANYHAELVAFNACESVSSIHCHAKWQMPRQSCTSSQSAQRSQCVCRSLIHNATRNWDWTSLDTGSYCCVAMK